MGMRRKRWRDGLAGAAALLGAAAWIGCDSPTKEACACDTEFRTFSIAVSDADGPVDSAQVRLYRVSDGSDITGYAYDPPGPGYAVAFTDDVVYDFPAGSSRMDVRVAVSKGSEKGEAVMTVAVDECRCHLSKLSGPDNVVLK